MNYKCLTRLSIKDNDGYQLITIRKEDIESIRLWRNNQMEVLRQKSEISAEEQQRYFQNHIFPTFTEDHPKQILFSFLFYNECIGYGGLTNIDWEASRAEVSFLVNPHRLKDGILYSHDFNHFLTLLCEAAFVDVSLHRLYTETFAFRTEHIKILEKFGFKREGVLREHIFKRNEWNDSIMHGLLAREWNRGK